MNAKDFFDTVKKMREAQKDYISTHAQIHQQKAKKYESTIDEEIKRVDRLESQKANPRLF